MPKTVLDVEPLMAVMQQRWDALTARALADGSDREKLVTRSFPIQREAAKFIYTELNGDTSPVRIGMALANAYGTIVSNLLAILPDKYRDRAISDIKTMTAQALSEAVAAVRDEEHAVISGNADASLTTIDGDQYVHTKQ